jgi:hypothetical protein
MLCMKVLGIAEARRRLPELVRRVSEGRGAVYLGRRGKPEVMLTVPGSQSAAPPRRSLVGLVEIVGNDDLIEARAALRAHLTAALEQRAARLDPTPAGPRRRRRA